MKYQKIFFLAFAFILSFSSTAVFGQEAGGVRGKIRTTRGDGIGSAVVTARQNGRDVKSITADADGKFALNGLAPGVYNIVFDKSGYSLGIKYNIEIEKNKIRDLGDRLILSSDKGTQVILNGGVFNQNDRSVAGARVVIEKISADGKIKKVGSGYTDISGDFSFRFPEGAAKYRVTAQAKSVKASKEIEVGSAGIYRLAISLNVEKEEN